MNSLEISFVNKTTSKKGNDIFIREVFWLVTQATKMGPSCPFRISRFDPAQTYKVRNSWTMSAMKSQKVAEKSQNKGLSCCVVPQTQLLSFLALEINQSYLLLDKAKRCGKKRTRPISNIQLSYLLHERTNHHDGTSLVNNGCLVKNRYWLSLFGHGCWI